MDKKYWENYYKAHVEESVINKQSSFSVFCLEKFFVKKKLNIVELGSGSGRDAIYFASHGHKVIALDQSLVAIAHEKASISNVISDNIVPIAEDFTRSKFEYDCDIDVFYSRFTLHAIKKNEEKILLPKVFNSLQTGGMFCVEVRTTKDSLCGVGESCGDNTYLTDHHRRFIDSREFISDVLNLGFRLLYFDEAKGLSVYKGDDPVLMRIILSKE